MCKIAMKAVQAVDYNGKLYHDRYTAAMSALADIAEQFVSKDRATLVKLLVANAAELTFLLEILEESNAPSQVAEGPTASGDDIFNQEPDSKPKWQTRRDLMVERLRLGVTGGSISPHERSYALSRGGFKTVEQLAATSNTIPIQKVADYLGWTLEDLIAWKDGE